MYMYICMSIYTYTFSGGNGPNESNQESSASHHPNINSKRRSWSVVGDPEEPLKGNSSQPHGVARALISKFMFFQRCSKKQVEFFMLKKTHHVRIIRSSTISCHIQWRYHIFVDLMAIDAGFHPVGNPPAGAGPEAGHDQAASNTEQWANRTSVVHLQNVVDAFPMHLVSILQNRSRGLGIKAPRPRRICIFWMFLSFLHV